MRPFFLLTVFAFFISISSKAGDPFLLNEIDSFGFNPGNLKLYTYIPPTKSPAKRPLVVVLHGCTQSARDAALLTGWNKLADLHNFIVIYPQQKISNNVQLCFNWFSPKHVDKGKGECESIYQMIRYIQNTERVDSTQIFITGMSAGAAMSNALMAVHPEVFNSGAVIAGGAYKIAESASQAIKAMSGKKEINWQKLTQDVKDQHPAYSGTYPRVIIYQGDKDPIVNYKNADYIIYQWTSVQDADTVPDIINLSYKGVAAINRFEYKDKQQRALVTYYEIKGLKHKLLNKPGDGPTEGGRDDLFSANIGYHSTYYIAKEFGLIKD